MAHNNDPLFVDPALLEQAEQLCKRRLKNEPANRAVLHSLADVHRKRGNVGEAAAAYERLIQLDPEDQRVGYMHAVLSGKEWPTAPTGMRAAPFVLLKDFLPPEFHDSLIPFLCSVRERFVPAEIAGTSGLGQYDPSYRETLDFTEQWDGRKRFKNHFKEILPPLIPRLYVAPFDVEKVELHVRAYQDGHFYKVHMDAAATHWKMANRVLSFVYFFHRVPRRYRGGELLLFDSELETDRYTKSHFTCIVPEDNCLVIFPSHFYHCVVPVQCPSKEFADGRFVINGFVRKSMTADRPIEPVPVEPASENL